MGGYGTEYPRWDVFIGATGCGNEEGGVCLGVRFVDRASAFDRGVGYMEDERDGEFDTGLDSSCV